MIGTLLTSRAGAFGQTLSLNYPAPVSGPVNIALITHAPSLSDDGTNEISSAPGYSEFGVGARRSKVEVKPDERTRAHSAASAPNMQAEVVPAPKTWVLSLFGGFALLVLRQRRR